MTITDKIVKNRKVGKRTTVTFMGVRKEFTTPLVAGKRTSFYKLALENKIRTWKKEIIDVTKGVASTDLTIEELVEAYINVGVVDARCSGR